MMGGQIRIRQNFGKLSRFQVRNLVYLLVETVQVQAYIDTTIRVDIWKLLLYWQLSLG